MDDTPASGSRRAALALHALDADDQQWVLSALGGEQQALLQGLLQELHDIGIAPDSALVEDLCRPKESASREVDAPDDAAIGAMLLREPPRLVAALLPGMDHRERERLLARFPAEERGALLAHESSVAKAPALQVAVQAAVRRRLPTRSPPPTPTFSALWRRLQSRLQARGRLQ